MKYLTLMIGRSEEGFIEVRTGDGQKHFFMGPGTFLDWLLEEVKP